MRLNEILIEKQLDEAPQGMLSRLANKAKSFVPGSTGRQAKGDLEVGKEANWLKKQFDVYLGKVRKPASPQLVIDFLRKNNYPTGDAEQEMTKVTKGQKVGKAVGTVAKGAVDAVKGVGKGIADVAKGAVAGAKDATADPKQDPNAQKTAQDNTQAPADTQNPTQKQPEVNPDNNISIKGQKNKKIVPPSQQNKQVVNQSIDWSEATFIFENDAAVSLSGGQLDNIFMAAVRQAIARDEGGQADTGTGVAPANAQQGGLKGAAQSAAGQFADAGSTLPPEIKKQLETLPARDKQQLLKML